MKRNKLLFLTPLICLSAIASCSQQESQAKKVADVIFNPASASSKTDNFSQQLKNFTDEDRANELVYDLFGWCNWSDDIGIKLTGDQSIKSLYEDNSVVVQTVINKCSFNSDLKANFLGYVCFIFNKKLSTSKYNYEVNDYIQITFDINDLSPEITSDCGLHYANLIDEKACVGIIKQRYDGGKENMFYIKDINTSSYPIKNWKNYI